MYSNIFERSVILSNIAFAFGMYPLLDLSIMDLMVEFKAFEEDMELIRISSL